MKNDADGFLVDGCILRFYPIHGSTPTILYFGEGEINAAKAAFDKFTEKRRRLEGDGIVAVSEDRMMVISSKQGRHAIDVTAFHTCMMGSIQDMGEYDVAMGLHNAAVNVAVQRFFDNRPAAGFGKTH